MIRVLARFRAAVTGKHGGDHSSNPRLHLGAVATRTPRSVRAGQGINDDKMIQLMCRENATQHGGAEHGDQDPARFVIGAELGWDLWQDLDGQVPNSQYSAIWTQADRLELIR